MGIIGIILFFWGISELVKHAQISKQQRAMEKLRVEQANQKYEQRRQAMELANQAREQARINTEQKKQAEILEKHTEQIEKLEFQMSKAEADIAHWSETVNSLYALLDIELAEQAGSVPGSKSDIKHQKAILTLKGKIHAAEQKIAKAKFDKAQAEQDLVA